MNKENRTPNHLINEKSPYLLQHAYNPVDWYPWSEEAFERANKEDKPIFLSIGYSTCHWCHVMERESFEDEEVAEILNQNFISIKVDKEERPDVDTIYMNICQKVNGHGGWPLTILMTAEQKPFFAGTYFPKRTRGQMLGLIDLLQNVARVWKSEPERLLSSADDLLDILRREEESQGEQVESIDRRIFGRAFMDFKRQFDSQYGGFGSEPKFPTPHNLLFLLRYGVVYKNQDAIQMVEATLEAMYKGGIYDHIGGGFSRYSTDNMWLVPHFEKMLYDNALLVLAYTEAYQVTKKPLYEKVVRETLQYIMAEMTDEQGGFYCAQDADSEGEEGKYYTFQPDEVLRVLGEEDGQFFNEYYHIMKQGNFEGDSIPNRIGDDFNQNEATQLKQLKEKLYEYRKNRMKLHKDDKILTSWNGLMITAFAKAYQVFRKEEYLETARKAYVWIQEKLRGDNRRLEVRYRDGHQFGTGNLEDYAFFILAQITMYEVTFEPEYLLSASKDTDDMIQYFWDETNGGFYFYGADAEHLILRPKEYYDGAIPSGNSVATYVLAKLEKLTREERFVTLCDRQINSLYGEIQDYPSAYSFGLCALMIRLLDSKEIVCVLKNGTELVELYELLQEFYLPNSAITVIEEHTSEGLALAAPYTKEYKRTIEEAEIYICENFTCHPPIKGMEGFHRYLKESMVD